MITKLNADGLRTLVLATADLREASFQPGWEMTPGRYRLDYHQSALLACKLLQISSQFAQPVALGLSSSWNDMLDWAGDHHGRTPVVTLPEGFQFPPDPVPADHGTS